MRNVLIAPMLASLVFCSLALMACEDDDVGVPCTIEGVEDGTTSGTLISTGSLDCLSRLCLQWEETPRAQCTQICESNEDCPEESPNCPEGEPYVCVVARGTGNLACCKMCVCRAYLTAEQQEGAVPSECQNKTPDCPAL